MRLQRYSIGSLLILIAIAAVGMAALRYPSRLWASTIYTVAAVVLISGVSNAILGNGVRRAYWLGFSLFGGAYFFLTLGSNRPVTEMMLDLLYPHVTRQFPQATLGTLPAPIAFAPAPVPPGPLVAPPPPPASVGTPFQVTVYAPQQVSNGPVSTPPAIFYPAAADSAWDHWTKPDLDISEYIIPTDFSARFSSASFRQISHSLAALFAATLGGIFVRWRYDKNSKDVGSPEATPGIAESGANPSMSA
jgi:hypothetical protein